MPRRIFAPNCTHVFGDTMCGYDRVNGKNALGSSTGIGQTTVTASTPTGNGTVTFTTSPAVYYTQGTLIGVTGANAGYTRTVTSVSGNQAFLYKAFFYEIQTGNTFHILPGCDHTTSGANGCVMKSNLLRYGGFPYVPVPESAV